MFIHYLTKEHYEFPTVELNNSTLDNSTNLVMEDSCNCLNIQILIYKSEWETEKEKC